MIIDNVSLNGPAAYLSDLSTGGPVDLAAAPHRGRTMALSEGLVLETTGVDLHIEANDLEPFMRQQDEALLRFNVRKELFPGLFLDPFRFRAHNIAGFEDFRRGRLEAMRAIAVEGVPTLVSDGDPGRTATWRSSVYRLARAMDFDAAAWELATSRLTPADAFTYSLSLHWWTDAATIGDSSTATVTELASGASPVETRLREDLLQLGAKAPIGALAYQLVFEAKVFHDSAFNEFEVAGDGGSRSIGRPLLRAVNLLETIEPGNHYYSLHELAAGAEDFLVFPETAGPRRRMFATVPLSASLAEDEYIEIEVLPGFAAELRHMTARVRGRVFARPAAADRPGG